MNGLGRAGNELLTAAGMDGCFELAPHCKRKQNDVSIIDSRDTALVTQAQYHESSPRSTRMARNRRLTTNKPRSEMELVLQYCVL